MIRKLVVVLLTGVICLIGVTSVLAVEYNEAPMLKTMVAAGELPPVEERLPEEPFVVGTGVLLAKEDLDYQIGKYGGTLRLVNPDPNAPDITMLFQGATYAIRSPGQGMKEVILRPRLFSDFKIGNNNTTFTFTIREGLKWSDGYPVTTEDVRFFWEDVVLNEKITPLIPTGFRTQGKPDGELLKLEIMDDYTYRISFPEPYGSFLNWFCNLGDIVYSVYSRIAFLPAHYLKQFHAKYTSMEDLKPYLEEEGLEDEWWTLFTSKAGTLWNVALRRAIGTPTLNPWIVVEDTDTRTVMERNPYYLAVDTAGNQLPYIDRLESIKVSNVEAGYLEALAGKVDYHLVWQFRSLPLFLLNEEKGGYKTHFYSEAAGLGYFFNLTYDDPVWRKIVRDIRFRKAIHIGINKEEMIRELFFGLAELPTSALPPEFNEYNPEEANRLLDEVGLDKRDEEGYRLRSDGKRFEFLIEMNYERDINPTEMAIEYLDKLGIKASMRLRPAGLMTERLNANEVQVYTLWENASMWRATGASGILPGGHWAPLWYQWYTSGGQTGEEPPEWIKELYQIDAEIALTVLGTPEYNKSIDKAYSWYRKYVPYVIWHEKEQVIELISKKLGNVPREGTNQSGVIFSAPQMMFFKE